MATESGDGSPLVSVVLPTYGRPEALLDALDSVAAQTYEPIEVVVVDDHSPEPVEPRVREESYPSIRAIRCFRHEENRGANAARNTGIEHAEGEFIAFLDDDDVWKAETIAREVATFREHGNAVGVVYTGSLLQNERGEVVGTHVPEVSGAVLTDLFCGKRIAPFSNLMVRASVIDAAGSLDERFPSLQDREWHFRLAQHCEYQPVREPLVVHRSTGAERISDDFEQKRDVSYPLLVEKHRPLAAEYGPYYERRLLASVSKTVGTSALSAGAYLDAVSLFARSLYSYPFSVETWLYLGLAAGGRLAHGPAVYVKRKVTSIVHDA
jgi:glycosyltransferase involved in cell wall biosynthesis